MDLASPDLLRSAVWSWAEGYSGRYLYCAYHKLAYKICNICVTCGIVNHYHFELMSCCYLPFTIFDQVVLFFCHTVINMTSINCTAMDRSRQGRWVTVPCDTLYYYTCSDVINSSHVVLSNTTATWKQAMTRVS